jgi:hypothetical protein
MALVTPLTLGWESFQAVAFGWRLSSFRLRALKKQPWTPDSPANPVCPPLYAHGIEAQARMPAPMLFVVLGARGTRV